MQIQHYSFTLPVAKPIELFGVNSKLLIPTELTAKVPSKIAKVALTVLAECTDPTPRFYKAEGWHIVAIAEGSEKKLFITEKQKEVATHIEAFACTRTVMARFAQDSSLQVQEVGRYSQRITECQEMGRKRARMFSIMQHFTDASCFPTNYGFIQQGKKACFFQELPENTLWDVCQENGQLHTVPEQDRLAICHGIAEAIHTLAKEGFTHRSITPERIFLIRTPTKLVVKLTDFSHAAKHGDWEAREQELGNLSWAAPESVQFMCAQGKYAPTDETISQNRAYFARWIDSATDMQSLHPLEFVHETLGNNVQLLPDSSVDIWTLGLLIHCFVQAKLTDIQTALNRIAIEKRSFHLVGESYALLSKPNLTKVENKQLHDMLAELDTKPFTALTGKLSSLSFTTIQLQVLFKVTAERIRQAVAQFEEELLKLSPAPKERSTLLALAQEALQRDPKSRPSSQAMVDALFALSMQEMKLR